MPVQWEPAAPIGLEGNLYAENFALQLRRQQQQAAQQQLLQAQEITARSAAGGGGSGGGIQAAINHRDDSQFAQQRQVDANGNANADRVAAAQMQQNHFSLQSQLSDQQLTQQETMRLARMKNAIGDVQSDPNMTDEEKNDAVTQLKTGISPLDQRAKRSKNLADQQMNEARANELDLVSAQKKRALEAAGKSAADRTSFVPDAQHLSAISADLQEKIPQGVPDRDTIIAHLATQEAMRQGLGSHVLTHADGKETIISGPGSKEHESAIKGEGGGAKAAGELTLDNWLKMRKHSEDAIDRKSKETKEGDIPGTKVPAHPDLQDDGKRSAAVEAHMKAAGMPANYQDFQGQQKPRKGYGYDPAKAHWNKTAPAAAATPAGETAPKEDAATVSARDKSFNEQANTVLNRDDLPQGVRTQAAEHIGVIRRLTAEAGGNVNSLPEGKKKEFEAAKKYLNENVPAPAKPAAAAAPAATQPRGWWQQFKDGDLVTTSDLTDPFTSSNPFTRKRAGAR